MSHSTSFLTFYKVKLGLTASAFFMILAALFFEHVMHLLPCIQCVYQRLGVVIILLGTGISTLSHQRIMDLPGLLLAYIGNAYLFLSAREHLNIINNTNPFTNTCEFTPTFPFSIPLDSLLPWLFEANGPCDVAGQWTLMGISMPGWVYYYSIVNMIILLIVILTPCTQQLFPRK